MSRLVLILGFLIAQVGVAESLVIEERIEEFKNQRVLYSSPYHAGEDAVWIDVHEVELSDDFVDDGMIVLNSEVYPVDQIFIPNKEGRLENLTSVYAYNGVGRTFFLRYYDKERLAVSDEKTKLLTELERCVMPFEEGAGIFVEGEVQSRCIDEVFGRLVRLFYSYSAEEILADYQAMVRLWFKSSSALSEADFCYGKCGEFAVGSSVGRAVELQEAFVRTAIENLRIE